MNAVRLTDGTIPAIYFVDLDGTLLTTSSEKFFIKHLIRRKILSPVVFAGFLLQYLLHPVRTVREGKGWNRSYLKGMSPDVARREATVCAGKLVKNNIRHWTLQSMLELRGSGGIIVLLSASLEYIVKAVAVNLPVDDIQASSPEITDNGFTGNLIGTRPWGKNKIEIAVNICKRHGVKITDCATAADSWSDRYLLMESGSSVAVCPDRRLKRLAAKANWRTVKCRHTKWA